MKLSARLIAGGTLAALGAATFLVPKDSGNDDRWTGFRATREADRRFFAALDDARAYGRIAERATAQEVARALPAVAAGTPLVQLDPRIPRVVASAFQATLAQELRAAGATVPRYPIAVVVLSNGVYGGAHLRQTVVLPDAAGQPCTVVLLLKATFERRLLEPTHRLLGPCGFFAAYGPPGVATGRWLRDAHAEAAAFVHVTAAATPDTARLDLHRNLDFIGAPAVAGCRSGRVDACRSLFGSVANVERFAYSEPSEAESLELTAVPGTETSYEFWMNAQGTALRSGMLASLAAELGPQQFGEIWRGDAGFPDEYRARQGRPLEAWIAEYVAARTMPYSSGPGVGLVSVLLAIGLTVGAALMAVRRAPRAMS